MATKQPSRNDTASTRFSDEEKEAMRERAKEAKAEARRAAKGGKGDGQQDLLAKVAEMPESDRVMAERIHAIVTENAPDLAPKTWYGMPAWARNGKVVCFFKAADKFKTRYATFGFEEDAQIDDGTMWPTSWGLTRLTAADEARIAELVKRA
jgi:uncharacterized protein YdhG (YjbR/CyaY superfamily)